MELERRRMLAGDVSAAIAESSNASDSSIAAASNETTASLTANDPQQTLASIDSLVFVDAEVEGLEVLTRSMPANAKVVLLSANSDALQEMTNVINQHASINSIHIISHGQSGSVQLGGKVIDATQLELNQNLIRSWKDSLSENADVLVYGCDVAAGASGEQFLSRLATLTGADVAGSVDATGSESEGGNWALEAKTGNIESALAVNTLAQSSFAGVLPITIFAAGETGEESMSLEIDGVTVATWDNIGGDVNSREFQSFTYDSESMVSADRIRVVFNNDKFVEGVIDRNLYVDRIEIDGRAFETESPSVFSTGTWSNIDGGITPGFKKSEALHSNGYFQFKQASVNSITVFAAGETGQESMALQINGETVASWENIGGNVNAREFIRFTFETDSEVSIDQIRVAFTNDLFEEGVVDRNLYVDAVEINGERFETEAPSVFSTGTWSDPDGVTPGYKHSEALHSNGYFQFASNEVANPSRTYDGSGNNIENPTWGSVNQQLIRVAPAQYEDGVSSPGGQDRPSAREISNVLADNMDQDTRNDRQLTALIYVWGQFLDHDIDLTLSPRAGGEAFPISVPTGDAFFDPTGTGTATIPLSRSVFDPATGTSTDNQRQQLSAITAFIDGSQVYGSSQETADSLRSFVGGRMLITDNGLLPTDAMGGVMAGDIRASENLGLTAMQALFVREHNRIANEYAAANPGLGDEEIFQHAREIVIAEIQAITFNEFLPALLGEGVISAYSGYDATVNPTIANEFSTAAFRFGHSTLDENIEFFGNDGIAVRDSLTLAQAFFNPALLNETGIDTILKYKSSTLSQEIDNQVVGSLRNFLFGQPGAGGLDLASLNIQRGRDHGLADYNSVRQAYGLEAVDSFSEITSNVELQGKLESLYGNVNNIDLWVGILAEDHIANGSMGELGTTILVDQFERLRAGDRFWYENTFSGSQLAELQSTTLADLIQRNTGVEGLQQDVFFFRAEVSGQVLVQTESSNFGIFRNLFNHRPSTPVGLEGATVQLIDDQGEVIATTQTDSSGNYRFTSFKETGNYRVQIINDSSLSLKTPDSLDVLVSTGDTSIGGLDFVAVKKSKWFKFFS